MIIPWQELNEATLIRLIESFVAREATDYGQTEFSQDEKVNSVLRQIKSGQALISFDEQSESCNIVSKDEYRRYSELPSI